ncbi:Crp/Fnr family transcriptional regulator [Fulvivirgaceae bacterium PWU4]|uniref:Crp/Fnr family transcriptional regulator n=1 Tax=Chryseosolibacter histidini TaxID=2782349 RepID=A0AAP2DL10_9BACT|nr:Crp/Fnr family transcriptional regulator [Chryseosolibacter histidini]MBT1697112.1 Crp/Fnr family transcriptional regulator [Chryseosolibacter histidini]
MKKIEIHHIRPLVNYYTDKLDDAWEKLLTIVEIKRVAKGHAFIEQGDIAKVCGLVLSGSFKNVAYDDPSDERILRFTFQYGFLASCQSFNEQQPSSFAVVAMEDSEILSIDNKELVELCLAHPSVITLGLLFSQQIMIDHEHHSKVLSLSTPLQRYEFLIHEKPYLLNRVSMTDLAKHLYTSREALSRARLKIRSIERIQKTT